MTENILSSLKPLYRLLKVVGLLNFDIDEGVIYETNSNFYGYVIVDFALTIAVVLSGTIGNIYDREFARIVLNSFLGLAVIKFIGVNVRRLVYGKTIAGIWQRLRKLEIDFLHIGVKLDPTYIRILGYSITISFVGCRIVVFIIRKVYFDDSNIYGNILFNITAVRDVPLVATKVEYMIYLLILRQYFKKFCTQDRFDMRLLQTRYTTLCDLTDGILGMLTSSVIVITIECLYILTFGFHSALSRIYDSENTKFWFFDGKYAALWGLEHLLGLVCILIPSYMCAKEANKIKDTLRNLNTTSKDSVYTKNIRLFSLKILHEDFKIAPAGLFTIDLGLVYVIFGTLTSYIIIIIQFDVMYFK